MSYKGFSEICDTANEIACCNFKEMKEQMNNT